MVPENIPTFPMPSFPFHLKFPITPGVVKEFFKPHNLQSFKCQFYFAKEMLQQPKNAPLKAFYTYFKHLSVED